MLKEHLLIVSNSNFQLFEGSQASEKRTVMRKCLILKAVVKAYIITLGRKGSVVNYFSMKSGEGEIDASSALLSDFFGLAL